MHQLKAAKFRVRKQRIAVDPLRMIDMMESMDGASQKESFTMMCFGLSLLYRSTMDAPEPGMAMTITDFMDRVGINVRYFIDNPPKGFEDTPPTPGCGCDVCAEKRERLARAH